MSYKALLFCPDEKAARTVTQVLTELDFQVEPCNEPFAAVKKLTTEHFDGVVVDCDNEQNAALLFKSARNSASNQTSLAVAVVEGQSGVAKAFRIGANLVLTKPINVEQSKGTLRVARGLLRKNEAAKTGSPASSASSHIESRPSPLPEKPPAAAVPPPVQAPRPTPSASISSAFEVEEEPEAKPEPTEAALLESMPDPVGSKSHVSDPADEAPASRPNPWQPSKPLTGPMADALKRAAAIAGKNDFEAAPNPAPSIKHGVSLSTSGAAAAAAPAKENPPSEDVLPSLGAVRPARAKTRTSSGGNKAGLIVAVVLLVAAAGGYFGWTKFHLSLQSIPFLKQGASQGVKLGAPAPAPSVATSSAPATTAPGQPSAEVLATPLPSVPDKPAPPTETVASTARKPATIAAQDSTEPAAVPVKSIGDNNEAIVVSNEAPKAVAPKPAPQELAEPTAPALNVASDTSDKAISGLVEAPATVPHAAAQTLKVSQGVSQGLLVKKVPPVYPPQAIQMRIQGAVQMQATISKEGNISSVKVVSGDAVLARAAIDAVKQWKYKPYYLDGQPVEIQTQITVNFSLP